MARDIRSANLRSLVLVALLCLFSLAMWPAHAADRSPCIGKGACTCFEAMSPKGVAGYNPDKINVTCINMKTMSVVYFTVPVDRTTASNGAAQ